MATKKVKTGYQAVDNYNENVDKTMEAKFNKEYFIEKNPGIKKVMSGTKESYNVEKYKSAVHQDITKQINNWTTTIFPRWVQANKNYQLCAFDRAVELQKSGQEWKTNLKQPVTRGYVDLCHRSIYTSRISNKVINVSDEDGDSGLAQKIIEWAWADAGTRQALNDIAFDVACNGVGYARSGYMSYSKARAMNKIAPQFEYVSSFNVFAEPFLGFYNQRVIYYRKIMALDDAVGKATALLSTIDYKFSKEVLEIIAKSPKEFSKKNFDNVKMIKYYEDLAKATANTWNESTIFDVDFKGGLCEYIEVWKKDTLDIFINGYLVASIGNPRTKFNIKNGTHWCWHPFKVFNFTRISGVWISDGAGTMLDQVQDQYDLLMNMIFDLARFNAGPMFIAGPGQTFPNGSDVLKYKPLGFIDINGLNVGDIKKFTLGELDASNFKVIADMIEMVNFNLMPTSYNQIQGVSRSATDSQYRYEGLLDSVKNMIASIGESLKLVYQEWVDGAIYLSPDEFKIPNVEKNDQKLIKILKKKIKGSYLYELEFDSVREMNKIIERQQANEILMAVERYKVDPETGKSIISNIEILKWLFEKYGIDGDKFMLDPNKSKDRIIASEKEKIDIQAELQAYQKEKMPTPDFDPNVNPDQVPTVDEQVPLDSGSNVRQISDAPVEDIPEPEMDMAEILKKSAE